MSFLDYSRVDIDGTVMPGIRHKVLRPTLQVMLADVVDVHRAENPDAAPLSK